jgi:NitT/TauT family transport system permease protein
MMAMKPRNVVANLLFALLCASVLLPSREGTASSLIFLAALAAAHAGFLAAMLRGKSAAGADIAGIVYLFLLAWEITTAKLGLLNPIMFPPPENVFDVFRTHTRLLAVGFADSMLRLAMGFSSAVAAAVSLGMLIGWSPKLKDCLFPIIKALAPIPPLVYTSYVIGIMPSFRAAAVFVIFLGVFFPNLIGVVSAVSGIDKNIIDSARAMNVSRFTMLYRILLPYITPAVVNDLSISVTLAFMTLTVAEMIGATTGLGYFVTRFAAFGNYTYALAGIILIGVAVTTLNALIGIIKRKTIPWAE